MNGVSSPRIEQCLILNNEATSGGGMNIEPGSTVELSRCEFRGNESQYTAALSIHDADVTVVDCLFTEHVGQDAISAYRGSFSFDRCVVQNNGALTRHASRLESDFTITNSLFARNSSGAFHISSGGAIINCTIVSNGVADGAAFWVVDTRLSVSNSIVIDHGDDPFEIMRDGEIDFRYSNVEGIRDGEGNIDANPAFVSASEGDYRLSRGSPCIDAGDSALVHPDTPLDLQGAPRIVDDAGKRDTGVGIPDVVDMGAFERQDASPFGLTVTPLPVRGDATVTIHVDNARPNQDVWVVYGVTGYGSTPVPALNVVLDLADPRRINGSRRTDDSGAASWIDLPTPGFFEDQHVLFQALQRGVTSNVIASWLVP